MSEIYVYDGSGRPDRVSSEEALDNPDKEVYSLPNGRPERIKVSEIENSDGFVYLYENGRPVRFRGRDSEFSPLRLVIDTNLITGTTFELPITGGSGSMRVDWGDGTEENFETLEDVSHEYASDGEYEINLYPTDKDSRITRFSANDTLTEVRNWGGFEYAARTLQFGIDVENFSSSGQNLTFITEPTRDAKESLSNIFDGTLIQAFSSGGDQLYLFNLQNDISSWDTSNTTKMQGAFRLSTFNQDISSWDVSNVTNMISMFSEAENFNQDLGLWELNTQVDLRFMFKDSGMSAENYARTLIGWANNIYERGGVVTNRELGAQGIQYSPDIFGDITGQFNTAVDAIDYLVNNLNWTITDAGIEPPEPTIVATFADFSEWQADTTLTTSNTTELTDAVNIGGDVEKIYHSEALANENGFAVSNQNGVWVATG